MKVLYGAPLPPGLTGSTLGELRIRVERLLLDEERLTPVADPARLTEDIRLEYRKNSYVNDGSRSGRRGSSSGSSRERHVIAKVESPGSSTAAAPPIPVDYCAISPLFWGETQPSTMCVPATASTVVTRELTTLVYPVKTDRARFREYLAHMANSPHQGMHVQVFVPSKYSGRRHAIPVGRAVVPLDDLGEGKGKTGGWYTVMQTSPHRTVHEHRSADLRGDDSVDGPIAIGKVKLAFHLQLFASVPTSRTQLERSQGVEGKGEVDGSGDPTGSTGAGRDETLRVEGPSVPRSSQAGALPDDTVERQREWLCGGEHSTENRVGVQGDDAPSAPCDEQLCKRPGPASGVAASAAPRSEEGGGPSVSSLLETGIRELLLEGVLLRQQMQVALPGVASGSAERVSTSCQPYTLAASSGSGEPVEANASTELFTSDGPSLELMGISPERDARSVRAGVRRGKRVLPVPSGAEHLHGGPFTTEVIASLSRRSKTPAMAAHSAMPHLAENTLEPGGVEDHHDFDVYDEQLQADGRNGTGEALLPIHNAGRANGVALQPHFMRTAAAGLRWGSGPAEPGESTSHADTAATSAGCVNSNSDQAWPRNEAVVTVDFSQFSFRSTAAVQGLNEMRINVRLTPDIASDQPVDSFSSFVHHVPLARGRNHHITLSFSVSAFSAASRLIVELFSVVSAPAVSASHPPGANGASAGSFNRGARVLVNESIVGVCFLGLFPQSREVAFHDPISGEDPVQATLKLTMKPPPTDQQAPREAPAPIRGGPCRRSRSLQAAPRGRSRSWSRASSTATQSNESSASGGEEQHTKVSSAASTDDASDDGAAAPDNGVEWVGGEPQTTSRPRSRRPSENPLQSSQPMPLFPVNGALGGSGAVEGSGSSPAESGVHVPHNTSSREHPGVTSGYSRLRLHVSVIEATNLPLVASASTSHEKGTGERADDAPPREARRSGVDLHPPAPASPPLVSVSTLDNLAMAYGGSSEDVCCPNGSESRTGPAGTAPRACTEYVDSAKRRFTQPNAFFVVEDIYNSAPTMGPRCIAPVHGDSHVGYRLSHQNHHSIHSRSRLAGQPQAGFGDRSRAEVFGSSVCKGGECSSCRGPIADWYVEAAVNGVHDRTKVVPASQKPRYGYECVISLPPEGVFLRQRGESPGAGGGVVASAPCLHTLKLTLWHFNVDAKRAGDPWDSRQDEAFWSHAALLGECEVNLTAIRYLGVVDGWCKITSVHSVGASVGYVHVAVRMLT